MPGKIPAGHSEKRPVLSLDVAATALDLAGLDADPQADGVSVLDWINKPVNKSPHDRIYWRMAGGKTAFRSGNWKIVRPGGKDPIELYHLASDLSESQNLASSRPDKLKELITQWSAMDAQMADPIVLGK